MPLDVLAAARKREATTSSGLASRVVNCFAGLHDLSSVSNPGSRATGPMSSRRELLGASLGQAQLGSSAISGSLSGAERRPFLDPATNVLPASKLREICLKHVAMRIGRDGHMGLTPAAATADSSTIAAASQQNSHRAASASPERVSRTRKELRRKLRASITAVIFSNALTQLRLHSLSKNLESHQCEPYRVLPAPQETDTLVGRAVCVFALQQALDDELLYFALDRCPLPAEGWEWQISPVSKHHLTAMLAQFEGAQDRGATYSIPMGHVQLVDVLVISVVDPVTGLLLPISVEQMKGASNAYCQIIRDFESRVNHITVEATNETGGGGKSNNSAALNGDATREHVMSVPSGTPTIGAAAATAHALVAATPDHTNAFLDIPLPTYQELQAMPLEVRAAVRHLAVAVFRRMLYPALLLRQRKKLRERLSRSATAYPLQVEQLLKLQSFEMWPPSLLDEMIQYLRPYTAERGEFILQESECPINAIYFLTTGTVQQVQKLDRADKRINAANSKVLQANVTGLCVFGQLSFVSADPRLSSIRTTSMCTFWRLFREDYLRVYGKLPTSVRTHVQDIAFSRRTQSVVYNEPLTIPILRGLQVFSTCGEAALKALLAFFRPMSVPSGHVLSTADGDGTAMFVLLRGRCGVFRKLRDGKKEEAHVQSIQPPSMVGDDALIGGGSHVSTIKTMTACDLYMISKEDFESCMQRFGSDWNLVVEQATKARQLRLLDSQGRFKEMAVNIPLVASILPFSKRTELSRLFKPILYHPKQPVCSSAHFADRVIIVVEGTVRFHDGRVWELGEAAGYTCIVPHRWAQSATAVTSSKLIELRYAEYHDFLVRHGALESLRSAVLALMFPKAASPDTLYWALNVTQKLLNPPMFPLSYSDRVNLCEEGFGMRVVSFGQQKVHRRATQVEPSALEAEVDASMQRIHDRVRKKQLARNSIPLTTTEPSTTTSLNSGLYHHHHSNSSSKWQGRDSAASSGSSAQAPPHATVSWSTSRLLLVKTIDDPSHVPHPAPSVAHHPVLRDYLERRRRPVAFVRPWTSMDTTSTTSAMAGRSNSIVSQPTDMRKQSMAGLLTSS